MREFFRGWRRKVGIVLLGLVCAVFGMWMRSRVVYDAISFWTGHQQQAVITVTLRKIADACGVEVERFTPASGLNLVRTSRTRHPRSIKRHLTWI
jgi:hypothetical protein